MGHRDTGQCQVPEALQTGPYLPRSPDQTPPGPVARGAHGHQSARHRAAHTSAPASDEGHRIANTKVPLLTRALTTQWSSSCGPESCALAAEFSGRSEI